MLNGIDLLSDKIQNGKIIKRCLLKINNNEQEYRFIFPEEYINELECEKADAWIILLIHKMLAVGGTFFIDGKVSKSLLDNMERYCEFWYVFKPEYKKVTLKVREEIKDIPHDFPNKAIMTFSGGLDSCFTLYRHRRNLCGRNNKNIEVAVFVYGMDIQDKEDFKIASVKAKEQCDDLGVKLILAETNFRKMPNDWNMEHLNVIVSILNLFKNYPHKIISSSMDVIPEHYLEQMPYSTNIVTDRLLSTYSSPLFIDDEAYTRTKKAALLKEWNIGVKNLRVCWQGEDKSRNCGECEKCLRTMFNFLAAGAGEVPAFNKISYSNLEKNIKKIYTPNLYDWKEILRYAEAFNTIKEGYLEIIRTVVGGKYSKKKHHSLWWHVRKLRF